MEFLTEDQLKCLTLVHLFKSGYMRKFANVQDLNNFIQEKISHLFELNPNSIRSVGMGIYSLGCATTFTFSSGFYSFLPNFGYKTNTGLPEELKELLENGIQHYEKYSSLWKKSVMDAAHLTPQGDFIGQKYLELRTGIIV